MVCKGVHSRIAHDLWSRILMLFDKIVDCCILITIIVLGGGVLGMWYATPDVTTKPSVESQVRLATIKSCGRAMAEGRSEASLWFMGIEFPIEMEIRYENHPHPDFCEPDSVLGDTCMVMQTTRHLESCTLK